MLAFGAAVSKEGETIGERLAAHLEKAMPSLKALAEIDWAAAMQRLNDLPKRSKDAMQVALAEGWFFGWHDGLQSLVELVESLAVTPVTGVEEIMVAYYRKNLRPFADLLMSEYPSRAGAIKAALDAHISAADGGYYLTIPVFIAQADGVLTEITGIESPRRDEKIREFRANYADNPEMLDLLEPFLELKNSDFMKTAKARQEVVEASGKAFTALNRHQVMHGERSDYGTEINSLKAFSFLVFAGLHMPAALQSAARGSSTRTD